MIAVGLIIVLFAWAVIATAAAVEAQDRAEKAALRAVREAGRVVRAENFAEECLAELKAVRHG